jgi:hypothetical protein
MTDKTLYDKLGKAFDESRTHAIQTMISDGVPVLIDAVRCDISVHTPRGWHPVWVGAVVRLWDDSDLPEPSRASHMS